MKTKTCIKCLKEKELTTENFYKDSENLSGHVSTCKECLRSKHKKYYDLRVKCKTEANKSEFVNWNDDAIYC